MYSSLTKALAMIVATTEAIELTSQTQGWDKEGAYLLAGQRLDAGESIRTDTYKGSQFDILTMQADCNLVLYHHSNENNRTPTWSSKTHVAGKGQGDDGCSL